MLEAAEYQKLKDHTKQIRKDCTNMFYKWGHGHFGGCFSCAEIMAVLYFHAMKVDPENPSWEERDRFLLGKGHAAAALFSALCQKGFFPREQIEEYGDLGAHLNTHPSLGRVRGLDASSGSLGHGLPIGLGMAYAAKMENKSYNTYVLLGDGECHEGMIWEGAMAAPQFKLDNLITIVDRNRLCIAGNTEDWMPLEPFAEKWKAFNWTVFEVDGHDINALVDTLDTAVSQKDGTPKVIIANTVKGKGVSYMEGDPAWHAGHMNQEQYDKAMREIEEM